MSSFMGVVCVFLFRVYIPTHTHTSTPKQTHTRTHTVQCSMLKPPRLLTLYSPNRLKTSFKPCYSYRIPT